MNDFFFSKDVRERDKEREEERARGLHKVLASVSRRRWSEVLRLGRKNSRREE